MLDKLIGVIFFQLLAVINSTTNFKQSLLIHTQRDNLYRTITSGFFFLKVSIKLYFLKLIVANRQNISELYEAYCKMMSHIFNGYRKLNMRSRSRKYVVLLGTLTVFMSITNAFFVDVEYSDWSWEYLILFRSVQFCQDIFLWSRENFENRTDELISLFGTELTPVTASLGVCRLFTEFFDSLQDFCFIDIWLLTALAMWGLTTEFNLPRIKALKPDFERIWTHYKNLQKMSDMLEENLGNFIKQIHMTNLFLCTYFLLKCMEGEYGPVFCLRVINIMKTCVAYHLAATAADMNNKVERWFLDNFSDKQTVKVGEMNVNTSFILYEISKYRFGIGKRNFFIDQTFNLKVRIN
ncbi:unnamed protein product [Orchesella dallaii]|uniref:Gustatory receptor n=1 Tax=Orchesella dallaii TaxID=48710 RepID=A0ABP1R158_9HEXA